MPRRLQVRQDYFWSGLHERSMVPQNMREKPTMAKNEEIKNTETINVKAPSRIIPTIAPLTLPKLFFSDKYYPNGKLQMFYS